MRGWAEFVVRLTETVKSEGTRESCRRPTHQLLRADMGSTEANARKTTGANGALALFAALFHSLNSSCSPKSSSEHTTFAISSTNDGLSKITFGSVERNERHQKDFMQTNRVLKMIIVQCPPFPHCLSCSPNN